MILATFYQRIAFALQVERLQRLQSEQAVVIVTRNIPGNLGENSQVPTF